MSSLSTAGRPARRLLSLACHGAKGIAASGSTDQLVAGTITRMKNTGRRGYAKPLRRIQPSPPSPSPSPSQTPRPSSPPAQNRQPAVGGLSRGPPRLLFSSSDVPDAAEWEIALKTLSNKDLTATECRKGARCYVSVATQYEGQWRPKLESGRFFILHRTKSPFSRYPTKKELTRPFRILSLAILPSLVGNPPDDRQHGHALAPRHTYATVCLRAGVHAIYADIGSNFS